jgi:hypothetical protein
LSEDAVDVLRRIYQSNRDWYLVAENKTQLLIAANGIFLTVFLGIVFGSRDDLSGITEQFGPDTWAFAGVSFGCVVGSIVLGVLSMWSYHNTGQMRSSVWAKGDPQDIPAEGIQVEWLWYYGYMARLNPKAVEARLKMISPSDEGELLPHHIADLSRKVWNKFQFVNYGWFLTGVSLISLAATAMSALIRS